MINKSRDDFTWSHFYGQFFKGYLKSRVLVVGIISDQTAVKHVHIFIYQGNTGIAHTRTWKRCCIDLAILPGSTLKQFSLPAKEISVEKDFEITHCFFFKILSLLHTVSSFVELQVIQHQLRVFFFHPKDLWLFYSSLFLLQPLACMRTSKYLFLSRCK